MCDPPNQTDAKQTLIATWSHVFHHFSQFPHFILSLHHLQVIFSFIMICHFDHSDFAFSTCIWAVSYLMCISTVKILGYNGHTFLWLVQVPVTFWKSIFTLRRQMILQFLNIKIFHTTIEVLRVWLNNKFIFIY